MVEAVPFDTFFHKPAFKSPLKVKMPDNTIAPSATIMDDASASIVPLFEIIGGVELAKIARQDLVGGVGLSYEIIGEVDNVTQQITAKMLKAGARPPTVTGAIDISKYISLVDLTDETLPGILIDEEGNLILSLLKLEGDEGVEIQALSGGNMIEVTYGLEEV